MQSTLLKTLLAALATACLTGLCRADVTIADSAAEYSSVQGQSNWYYGFYDGDAPTPFSTGDFEQLPQYGGGSFGNDYWFMGNDGVGGFWTNINAVVMHPNGPSAADGRQNVLHWSVRRWVSEVTGLITLSGNVADSFSGDGDGIIGRIIIDGTQVFSTTINDGNSVGANYSFAALVNAGSFVDFAVDPRSNDHRDHTPFTAVITTAVPEASAFALCGVGGIASLLACAVGKRRILKAI